MDILNLEDRKKVIDGRQCLVIAVDDYIEVNRIPIKP